LFANDTNRVRGAVLCLSQDGACTNLFENFSENNLKGDLSNDTTDNPPLFSLVNTFKVDPQKLLKPVMLNMQIFKRFKRGIIIELRSQYVFGTPKTNTNNDGGPARIRIRNAVAKQDTL
jgi:hypothetical protein